MTLKFFKIWANWGKFTRWRLKVRTTKVLCAIYKLHIVKNKTKIENFSNLRSNPSILTFTRFIIQKYPYKTILTFVSFGRKQELSALHVHCFRQIWANIGKFGTEPKYPYIYQIHYSKVSISLYYYFCLFLS